MLKVIEVLEGGDEFTGRDVEGEIFNGVANCEHGFVIEYMVDVRAGDGGRRF